MKALNVPAAGEQPVITDLPVPQVAEGTVLVKVKAVGLNPVDNHLVARLMAGWLPHEYPLTLGRDAAGVVEAVGAGVDHVSPGDEVIGHMLLVPPVKAGTLAEYAALPAAAVTAKPAGLSFVQAAALPLSAGTAAAVVDAAGPKPGQPVLVVGAGGGVGSFAVQLLAARGATVVATGKPADTGRLTGLGAATVIDYTAGPVAEQVLAAYPDGVGALIDLVAYAADALPLTAVRKDGKVVSTLNAADDQVLAAQGLTGANINGYPVRELLAPLAEQAAAGTLKIRVSDVLPLEKAADGLAAIAAGNAHGKIVVAIGD
jgi:NADPH:quinone reductase-like Zn-dependent oxidoreductase